MGRHLEVLLPRNHTFAVANKCRYFLAIDCACAIPDRITSAKAKSRVFILISIRGSYHVLAASPAPLDIAGFSPRKVHHETKAAPNYRGHGRCSR